MAKIVVAGDAVVVTSALKSEDIKTLEKYSPKALVLFGGEDGKDEIFRICTKACGCGNLTRFGAEFNGINGEGFATLTLSNVGKPADIDVKEWVADNLGEALIKLNALEAAIPAALADVIGDRERILADISVLA